MAVTETVEPSLPFDDGIDPARRRTITLLAVWLLVGFDAILTALTVGAWAYLRSNESPHLWRFIGCTPAHPCLTPGGYTVPGPVPLAGTLHLAGVIAGALLLGAAAWQAERAARAGKTSRWTGGWVVIAVLAAVGALGMLAVAYKGLLFNRFDGAYSTAYWYFLVSCAVHLTVAGVVLAGFANRIRLVRSGDDTTTFRAIKIFAGWTAIAVTILCIVASVGG